MAGNVKEITEADFEQEVLKSDQPVLVDFWAPWCHPCRMIAPIVEELAGTHDGKLKVAKLNVDEAQGTASSLGIQSIPTLIIFKGGQEIDRIIGAASKTALEEKVAEHI